MKPDLGLLVFFFPPLIAQIFLGDFCVTELLAILVVSISTLRFFSTYVFKNITKIAVKRFHSKLKFS